MSQEEVERRIAKWPIGRLDESRLVDLEQAADYGRDSPNYAATLLAQARDTARSLDRFAERGRVVPELRDAAIREVFVGSYRLVYRILLNRVEVLALVHGARDLAAIWQRRTHVPATEARRRGVDSSASRARPLLSRPRP